MSAVTAPIAAPLWLTYLPAVSAAVAAIAFAFSVFKNRQDLYRSREVSARGAWDKYLEMAFENPKLALADLDKFTPLEFEKYEWFVSRMLYAAEEVLALTNDDRNWNGVIETQIGFHSPYLCGQGNEYNSHYSAGVQKMLNRVCTNA